MALLEDLKAQADSVGEEYPKSLTLRASAEIKELRKTLSKALSALEQADVLARALRIDANNGLDISKELRGELNITEPTISHGIAHAQDTLEFGL